MSCGHVGCCDNSPNRHATAHFRASDHPIIQSYEPGEDWWFCYLDELAFLVDGPRSPTHEHRRSLPLSPLTMADVAPQIASSAVVIGAAGLGRARSLLPEGAVVAGYPAVACGSAPARR